MNKKTSILFSVLIPVYNVQDYLIECIQSVLSQTYTNYEIIIVDDGSTDNSCAICDKFAARYPLIKVFHKANQGLIHTRRYAIMHASGDYFVMLDADDLLERNALEVLYSTILKHSCDCVFFNRKQLIKGKIVRAAYHIDEEYTEDKRVIHRKALIEMPYNALVLKCAKATLFTGVDYSNYYHIQKGEDLLQSLELLENCRSAEFIDNELYIYRRRIDSITNTVLQVNYNVDFTVRKLTLEYIEKENVFTKEDINEYRDKCIRLLIDQIIEIGKLSISNDAKKDFYNEIRNDSYYREYLSKGITNWKTTGHKVLIYILFKKRFDNLILMLVKMRN